VTKEYEDLVLAPYAMHSSASAGRRYAEPEHAYRTPYQRDRDRIVHSAAYRRLSYKTQVFTGELGDYHRTRLTHTLEVASIARTLARTLALNEDLAEALALMHDIGHPPFGHAGEEVLNDCLADCGGFDHNRQALRTVEKLEVRYPDFAGLNLTAEVLDGQARRVRTDPLSVAAQDTTVRQDAPLLEVQIVDAADSVAYDTHDADDALELGLLSLDELIEEPLWQEAAARVRRKYVALAGDQLRRAVLRELIDWQVSDLLATVVRTFRERDIESVDDVRRCGLLVVPSPEVAEPKRIFEAFLFERVYRHPNVLATRRGAKQQLHAMFHALIAGQAGLPEKFIAIAEVEGPARAAADYLAGMTDRYARQEYERLRSGPFAE
jgi:dGTPase